MIEIVYLDMDIYAGSIQHLRTRLWDCVFCGDILDIHHGEESSPSRVYPV